MPDYDVLVVADEAGRFGDYLPYRSWDARPVAGTQGLVPTSWHPALELWGATQFQNRFLRLANRPMRPSTTMYGWRSLDRRGGNARAES